ncbi:MAG: SCP2 sterol-binding domain-containing protein [Candidatus Hodarchaeales archaeon]|jgi:putative sterol carrier protein
MSEEELTAEIKRLAERNDEQRPMKDWSRDILFFVSDLEKGYHAFFSQDGTISEIKHYDNMSEEETEQAHVILEGNAKSWLALLRGEIKPTRALLLRKIKATKGSAREVAPFAKILGG